MIRYIDAHQGDPFYLFSSYIEPHHQNHLDDYPPPDGYRERYAGRWIPPDLAALSGSTHQHIAGYYGMVKRLDEALGRVLDALKSLDLLDNTILPLNIGSRLSLQDAEMRNTNAPVTKVLSVSQRRYMDPASMAGGSCNSWSVLLTYRQPFSMRRGFLCPKRMQGRSILPLTRGETEEWPEEVFVQVSEAQVGRAVRTHRWKYGVAAPGDVVHREQDLRSMSRSPFTTCRQIPTS